MENLVSAIVCPNCGANTSNRLNCEYCGSMLVRFTDHGISIDPTKYGNGAKAIDGLEEALAGNLSLQETCGENEYVITNMTANMEPLRIQFIQSDAATIGITGNNPLENATRGNIALRVPFAIRSDNDEAMMQAKAELDRFRKMDCFSLFTPQQYDGGISFYIDFGRDTLTAAQVFSQIAKEIDREGQLFDFQTVIKSKEDITIDSEGTFSEKTGYGKQITIALLSLLALIVFIIIVSL